MNCPECCGHSISSSVISVFPIPDGDNVPPEDDEEGESGGEDTPVVLPSIKITAFGAASS